MLKKFIALTLIAALLVAQPIFAYSGGYAEQGGGGTDATIVFSDVTTNDVSTTQHGFAPKAPNNTYQFLRADASYAAPLQNWTYAMSDESTALTTGTGKVTWNAPCAMTVTAIRAGVITAPTGSTIIVDVNEAGTTLMSATKLSIDATEKTSTTAASAAVLSDTTIADDAIMTADTDQVGSTIAGVGLKITVYGRCTA